MIESLQVKFHAFAAKAAHWAGEKLALNKGERLAPQHKAQAFFQEYPLSGLLPYEAFDEQKAIFINKKSLGFILMTTPLTGATEETETILASLISDVIPPKTDVQFLLWASDKVGHVFDAFEKRRSGQGETFEWLAKKRTAFLKKGTLSSLSAEGSFLLRDFRLLTMVSLPKKSLEEDILTLVDMRQNMQSALKSINILTHAMTAQDFLSLMSDLVNPHTRPYTDQPRWNKHDPLNLQITDPEYRLSVFPDRVEIGNETELCDVRCFTVKSFPAYSTQWRMSESIGQLFNNAHQIPCPFLISLSLRSDNESASLKTQWQFVDKDAKAKSPLAKFNPHALKESEEWHRVRERVSEGDKLVKVFFQVVLYAKSDEAKNAEAKLLNLYLANGWQLKKARFLQFQSWLAMLPMMTTEGLYQDLKTFGRLKTLTAFNAITLTPLQGEWKGTKTPSLLLPGRRGQIAVWHPFDNAEGNYNVAIAAKSGSGKSVFTQEYINAVVGSGGRVWVIDVGRSYQKTCQALGGEFIEFHPEKAVSLNPFTHIRSFDQALELLKPLASAMARPSGKTCDEEAAWLEKGLKAAWTLKGNGASFTDVSLWLGEQTDEVCKTLSHLLYPYTQEGMYGRYFEGACSLNLDNPFVVLELEELKSKKDLQRIMLLVLMYHISERMYLGDRLQVKSCIIDEAWDLLDGENEGAAKFIETGYRKARRYHANFVTITQSINDYFKNAVSLAAYENSDNNVILSQKPESIDQLKSSQRLKMDDFLEKLYKSLRKTDEYSECVIKSPSGISVHRLILDPFSRILYSSKGEEFEQVKHWQSQGYTLHQAIEKVAAKFNV